jgi:protein gp37
MGYSRPGGAVEKSKIEWTDSTWNPTTGCSKVSNGCDHCYAEAMALRLKALGTRRYVHGFDLTIHEDLFELPLRWKKPRNIFVNSMSDLFHEDVPFPILQRIFETMNRAHWHNFQILTKRSMGLVKYADRLTWTPNIWIGVTVESDRYLHRLRALQSVPAVVRFVSFEPLLTSIPSNTDLSFIDWAIVGGESGTGARPMDPEWVAGVHGICQRDNVAFFFKQWGGFHKNAGGRLLDGREWDEMPTLKLGRLRSPAGKSVL